MCLIKVCAYKYVHAYMTMCTDANVLGKNVSARVQVCIREQPRFRYNMNACMPVCECMYVTVIFAVGIVLCKRGGRLDDTLLLVQCQTG